MDGEQWDGCNCFFKAFKPPLSMDPGCCLTQDFPPQGILWLENWACLSTWPSPPTAWKTDGWAARESHTGSQKTDCNAKCPWLSEAENPRTCWGATKGKYIFEVYSEGHRTQRLPLARGLWGVFQPSPLFLGLAIRLIYEMPMTYYVRGVDKRPRKEYLKSALNHLIVA